MLEDVQLHRPTEVDQISGALVREAERLGVPVPLHTALWRLVKAREASWSTEPSISKFYGEGSGTRKEAQ
jgi:2-dehydropantoate 2-reductase